MTIIRTAEPRTAMEDGFRAGIDAMRISLDAAERGIGEEGRGPSVIPPRNETWGMIDVSLAMRDHPQDHRMLEIGFSANDRSTDVVRRWTSSDPSAEIIVLAREALVGIAPDGASPAPDHADLVAIGLAWSILEEPLAEEVMIQRGTPWSAPQILVGRRPEVPTPGLAAAGWSRFAEMTWTPHHPSSTAENAAIAGMRQGTCVLPHGQDARLKHATLVVSVEETDPMPRLRALAAWAEFERGRP